MRAFLFDATTLRNLAICGLLGIVKDLASGWSQPHWTQAVQDEIQRGNQLGETDCLAILAESWLGAPIVPTRQDQRSIQRLVIALNDGSVARPQHAGEAESIHFAAELSGSFATDDNGAHDFASRRLGVKSVFDSVAVMRLAVERELLDSTEAAAAAQSIRASGRFLRRAHPANLNRAYFD